MLKANELRIGNYINAEVSNGEETVHISGGTITGILEDSVYLNGVKFPLITLRPIPFTEEWIIKFEPKTFIKYYDSVACKFWDYRFETKIYADLTDRYISFEGNDLLYFQYVHEYQNIIFSLTGEELIIKN